MSGPSADTSTDITTSRRYADSSQNDLLSRIADLESQLRTTQTQLSTLLAQNRPPFPATPPKKGNPKPFDASKSSTRFIALKLAYLGSDYNGFEHANNSVTAKPTVEEVLYKAFRKARLISPELSENADQSTEVVWDTEERLRLFSAGTAEEPRKKKLILNWDGCEYSKCGRTDRGVSAFGQVIALRVRSSQPLPKQEEERYYSNDSNIDDDNDDSSSQASVPGKLWDSIHSELPYVSLLNSILPATIRMLAWCPHPPPNFSARFSCRERRYRYFFTNPAFCPTPGPIGMTLAPYPDKSGKLPVGGMGAPSAVREGWLDIDRMREAARRLVGLHDYRNLCKIDPSNQMTSCERRITHADIEEWPTPGTEWTSNKHLNLSGEEQPSLTATRLGIRSFVDDGPKVYTFSVHGSAFLWHQVRCMMGVLFLVGQGLEESSIIDALLDIRENPRKPLFEMADDTGLVLWDCVFGDGVNQLRWIYAGDEASLPTLSTKHDGKFGLGSLTDVLWKQWRQAKMDEVLSGSLLDLTLSQGDGSAMTRGGFRDPAAAQRNQKLFDGGNVGRMAGKYVKIMDKPRMDTLEAQNEKYLRTRKVRRDMKREPLGEVPGGD